MDPNVFATMEGMGDNSLDAGGGCGMSFEGVPITLGGGGRISGCVEDEGGGGKLKLEPVGMAEGVVDIMAVGLRLEERGVCDLEVGGDEKVEPGFEAVPNDDGASVDMGLALEDATGTLGNESDTGMTDGC